MPAESQEDRLDRLHTGDHFLGLSAKLHLDGSYAPIAHDGEPEPGTILLTEPGIRTLTDEGLKQAHEGLAPRARAYGDAEDGQSRSWVYGLSREDLYGMIETLDTIEDSSSSVLYPEHGDFCSSAPSGMTEREVIAWVYAHVLTEVEYANRDEVSRFMLDYYPDIEAARDMEPARN